MTISAPSRAGSAANQNSTERGVFPRHVHICLARSTPEYTDLLFVKPNLPNMVVKKIADSERDSRFHGLFGFVASCREKDATISFTFKYKTCGKTKQIFADKFKNELLMFDRSEVRIKCYCYL
jgi:hypothetical protein